MIMGRKRKTRAERQAEKEARRDKKKRGDALYEEVDTVPNHMKNWETYRVAIQLTSKGPLHVFTVKENDRNKVAPFVRHMYELKSLEEAAFCEIHRIAGGGQVEVIYGDLNSEWPRTREIWHKGYRVQGKSGRMLSVGGSENQDPIATSVRTKQAQALADAKYGSTTPPATRTPVGATSTIQYHHGERYILRKLQMKVA